MAAIEEMEVVVRRIDIDEIGTSPHYGVYFSVLVKPPLGPNEYWCETRILPDDDLQALAAMSLAEKWITEQGWSTNDRGWRVYDGHARIFVYLRGRVWQHEGCVVGTTIVVAGNFDEFSQWCADHRRDTRDPSLISITRSTDVGRLEAIRELGPNDKVDLVGACATQAWWPMAKRWLQQIGWAE